MEPPLKLEGALYRFDPKDDPTDNCFEQGGKLYRLLDRKHRDIIIMNTANNMMGVTKNIKYRHAVHCLKADEEYGELMSKALKLDFNKVKELAKLSNDDLNKKTAKDNL